jgi:anti-anti-sigma regulatory factor
MVFSLFRKSDKADESVAPEAKSSSKKSGSSNTRSRHKDKAGRRAAKEAARRTAEKIDQIESEMIEDDDPLSLQTQSSESKEVGSESESKAASTPSNKPKRRTQEISAHSVDDVLGLADDVDATPAELNDLEFDSSDVSAQPIEKANELPVANADTGPEIAIIDGSLPGELEEAAILFSNGENEIAEGALLDYLESGKDEQFRIMNWNMLFDLYRATGDRDAFERVALQYSNETESSPPTWTDELAAPKEAAGPKPGAKASRSEFSNVVTDEEATKAANQLIRAASHKRDCAIDFSVVTGLSEGAADELLRLFEAFGENKHPLKVIDIDMLITAAKSNTETGRADSTEVFWKLTMMCLRIMDLNEEFDETSIDYCVTFEISPPPWVPYPGNVVLMTSQEAGLAPVEIDPVEELTEQAPDDHVVFDGELSGKIEEQRTQIKTVAERNSIVRVDCSKLRRLDFTAAGELLNEQLALQNNQRRLHFQHPNYLVYALMHVMGMHEFADITPRPL